MAAAQPYCSCAAAATATGTTTAAIQSQQFDAGRGGGHEKYVVDGSRMQERSGCMKVFSQEPEVII